MDDIDNLIAGLRRKPQLQEKPSHRLKKAWVAERMCPEILPFASQDTQMVMDEVKELISYIDEHSFEIENSTDRDIKVKLLLIETQLERLKFLVRSYLRARISKIDANIAYYSSETNQHNLSRDESRYAFNHFQLQSNLYQSSFMGSWPTAFSDLQGEGNEQMVDEPKLSKPVAVKITRDSFIGQEEAKRGELWMTPYNVVREYVGTDMELV